MNDWRFSTKFIHLYSTEDVQYQNKIAYNHTIQRFFIFLHQNNNNKEEKEKKTIEIQQQQKKRKKNVVEVSELAESIHLLFFFFLDSIHIILIQIERNDDRYC